MQTLLSIERWLKNIERVFCYVAAGLVFVMIFPTTVDVVLRYVFNAPLPEMFQLTEFMMVGVVYLGIAYVQQLKDHIKIEIATQWMPRKGQDILDLFGNLVGLFIFGLITWQTGRQAWEAWDTQDYTMGIVQFPLWPAKEPAARRHRIILPEVVLGSSHRNLQAERVRGQVLKSWQKEKSK